jgi:hypothetical protein
VFLISGLWHGANWTFVVWGGLHGAYLIGGIVTTDFRNRIWARLGSGGRVRHWVAVVTTFHLVTFAWIFFRADSISTAFTLVRNLFVINDFTVLVGTFGAYEMLLSLAGIAVLESVHLLERRKNFRQRLDQVPALIRWGLYYVITMSILLFGVINEKQAFIYFQF